MRVIAGSARGRQLKAPEGMGTRPMADRVKESLFNILASMGFPQEGDRVLDLYAGTGSLGIEALSRGAGWCDFVEQNAKVVAIISANLSGTGLKEQGRIYQESVPTFLARHGQHEGAPSPPPDATYDIIFLDPPYADPAIAATLALAAGGGLLHPEGLLILGHARQVEPAERLGDLAQIRQRRFGGSAFTIYRHPDAGGAVEDEASQEDEE